MRDFKILIYCGLFFLIASCSLNAQEGNPTAPQKSCWRFVQVFYDWYVPKALEQGKVPSSDLVLQYKRSALSSRLFRALKEDSEAQAKANGNIVGLDFDPFLNTQDPAKRYVIGKIIVKGDRYWAEVYSVSAGKRNQKTDVMPELLFKDGQWHFVNFHYPNPTRPEFENLLSLLKKSQEIRSECLGIHGGWPTSAVDAKISKSKTLGVAHISRFSRCGTQP